MLNLFVTGQFYCETRFSFKAHTFLSVFKSLRTSHYVATVLYLELSFKFSVSVILQVHPSLLTLPCVSPVSDRSGHNTMCLFCFVKNCVVVEKCLQSEG